MRRTTSTGKSEEMLRLAAVVPVVALLLCACGGTTPPGHGGRPAPSAEGSTSANQSTSAGVTPAFVHCMRAHGVSDFPDPEKAGNLFRPGGPVDPNSPQFQAALNGPCRALAPAAWVASGTVGGGS